jgi:chromosome segregation ATPase
MRKKQWSVVTLTILSLLGTETGYGEPWTALFGGKKDKEQLLKQMEQECQVKIDIKNQEYQRLLDEKKDESDAVQGLRDKNSTLMEAYEKLRTGQEALVEQLNRLRRENQRCDVVKESYDQMNLENEAFMEENKALEVEKEELKVTIENLKLHMQDLNKESEEMRSLLAAAQIDEEEKTRKIRGKVQKELEDLIGRTKALKEENAKLEKNIKDARMNAAVLQSSNEDLEVKLDATRKDIDAMEAGYLEIKQQNRYLEQEASEFPKRFTDLARHNRKLVKETADMHFNLGVSFIKSQEYERAIREFNQVIELKPDDADAYYNLGYIYAEHLVDRPMAVQHFKDYLAHAKDAKDRDWVKQYIFTWQTWYGKEKVK